jgi:hypothetical protein
LAWTEQWEPLVRRLAAEDVELRTALTASAHPARDAAAMRVLDRRHQRVVRAVLGSVGWPTAPPWAPDSVHALWLLVQHCPDRGLQRQALDLLRRACAAGRGDRVQLAHLEDRVLVRDGKPQRYGTQLVIANGAVRLVPLDDHAAVGQLRREAGLPPLADYLREMSVHLRGLATRAAAAPNPAPAD